MRTPEHIDIRPAIGLWAPGEYFNHCKRCNLIFVGDKRALSCANCAYRDEEIRAKAFASGRAQGLGENAEQLHELRDFAQRATLDIQRHASMKPHQWRMLFNDAYRLYSKYDLDGTQARNAAAKEGK